MKKETIKATQTGIEVVREVVETQTFTCEQVTEEYKRTQQALATLESQHAEAFDRLTKEANVWEERYAALPEIKEEKVEEAPVEPTPEVVVEDLPYPLATPDEVVNP